MGAVAVLLWLVGMVTGGLHAQRSPRFDYFYHEAEKCMRNNDASAVELFSHCLEIDSTAAEALYSMGIVRLALQDSDSVGMDMLERACRIDSCNATYLKVLASIYLEQRNTDRVIAVLERLASLQKHPTDVLDQLISVYQSVGQNEKAMQTLQRMELIDGPSENLSYRKSNLYNEMGMPDSARAEMQRLCEAYPREPGYKLLLATKYVEEDRVEDARQVLEEVQRDNPGYDRLVSAWLYFYQHTDWPRYLQVRDSILLDSATSDANRSMILEVYARETLSDSTRIPLLERAYATLTSRPDCSVDVLLAEASWYARMGKDASEIAGVMERVLDKDAGNDTAIRYLLYYYIQKGGSGSIEDMCRRGLAYHPEEIVFTFYLSSVLLVSNQDQEAQSVLTQGLQVRDSGSDDKTVSACFSMLGDLLHEQGKDSEAFAAYDSSLVYNRENIPTLNNYAYFLSLTGTRLDEAEEMSYRTVVLEPRNATYLDTYAWILFLKKKYSEARVYMNRAADPALGDGQIQEREELNGNILEHAGDIHACCGDMEQALRFWKLAVQRKDGTCSKRISAKIKKRKYLE